MKDQTRYIERVQEEHARIQQLSFEDYVAFLMCELGLTREEAVNQVEDAMPILIGGGWS